MRDIHRPDNLESIVDRLTVGRYSNTNVPVFPTIMDLLICAAGIGLSYGRRVPVPSSGKAIPIRIFENQQKEGYIHLVALASSEDPSLLSIEKDDVTARTFEEYAAGGLEIIGEWLSKNPDDLSGVETLLIEMQKLIPAEPQASENPSPL